MYTNKTDQTQSNILYAKLPKPVDDCIIVTIIIVMPFLLYT